jgi:hypothetical protein
VTDRLGLLLFLMLAVVAFELGAAPYLEPSAGILAPQSTAG